MVIAAACYAEDPRSSTNEGRGSSRGGEADVIEVIICK